MSEAPKRITAWGDQATLGVVYKAGPRPMQNMVPFRATEYTRADLSDALLREAMEVLGKLHHAVCGETGFAHCVRLDSGMAYPWPALDDADENARATLAKLRSHMGGNHE